MSAGSAPKAEPKERKRWLETLLDRMSAPADIMRQHLGEEDQPHALGSAAEKGVRDLLRLVVPRRLAVTSGFLREPGRSLAAVTPAGSVSPQTDVIVFDSLYAMPLHSIGDVDIVAAPDALGVIEVKDTNKGSEELASARGVGGALAHMARLSALAPNAFRAIVLFRGKELGKSGHEEAGAKGQPDAGGAHKGGRPALPEIVRVKHRLTEAKLAGEEIPHVIYCASYPREDGEEGSYLAFHDFRTRSVQIHGYHGDRTRALAGFLRILTGFFAVRGLISPSLHLDLLPTEPESVEAVADATGSFGVLHEQVLRVRSDAKGTKTFYESFVALLKRADNAVSKIVTGRNVDGLPTAGAAICVDFTVREQGKAPVRTTAVAFFYLVAPQVFVCTDASAEEASRWIVEDETVEEYRRRALRDSERLEADNIAPGKRPEAESEAQA